MNKSKFNPELYKCKAISLADNKTVLNGYYSYHSSGSYSDHSILVDEYDDEIGRVYANMYEINPYTICRNTGIKINNDYLYEFDLVLYRNGLSRPELGYVDFDDFQKSYVLRTSLNYTSYKELRLFDLEKVGNIVLSDDDYKRMQEYSDQRDSNYSPEPKVECRSTQRLNKLAKQFLPR
ncbi:hypothetical protein P4H70_23225 [Paenibacillus ehimensis]|uniref:hypothetical protein n=1 Tax=Paenibacillus ehimensis TaxID=79264 RepID=UPI002DB9F4FC|nr:hypothetical protein [Paenibacillus ehimensis]MEC0211858.1 hypothetical protein [Paenibacillus ehimensis]